MTLTPGTRLGVYEVNAQIGEGGMGQVYRATDTKLKRQVAIKIIPPSLAADHDRLARFQREAEILASLNHPHIAAIYGLEDGAGITALVMELVEGEDLSRRISRGAMPLDEALPIAKQIAEALEAAHERGIVHRDLKPANIKLRRDGTVKVLDFGLAKIMVPASEDDHTLTAAGTEAGLIMGTPAYMSPEQARGETAGRQTDIWSFGVVFYELLTGASPFGRHTTAETLATVLGAQPDYALLPSDTPAIARHLLRRCLEKDRKRRLQDIGDVRIEIEDALAALAAGPGPGAADARAATHRSWRAPGAIALALLAAAGGWFLAHRFSTPAPAAVVRLSIPSLEPPFPSPYGSRHLAIAADGSSVAFASVNRLWIRRMGQKDAIAIDVAASNPFFSPDGKWVGFFDNTGLKKALAVGGSPVSIAPTTERPGGGTWRADGTIVYATLKGLYQISENGGEPRLLVKPDPLRRERAYAWPRFITDGRSLLFTIVPDDAIDGAQIAVLDMTTLVARTVVKGGSAAWYTSTGHLVYASGQTLRAVVFDPATQQTRGDPVSLPDVAIATTPDNAAAEFAISETGTLVFIAPNESDEDLRTLSWVDHQGKGEPVALAPGKYQYPRISPDGTRVALDVTGANRDIWILDLQRSILTRLTDGPTEDLVPVWSVDGNRVFFGSDRTGNFDVYSQAADGATRARLEFAGPGSQMPTSFSPDGTRLLVVENFKDLSVLNLARPDHLEPLLNGELTHWLGVVSPDGNWVAYESNESGNQTEIFLRPFPNVSERREKLSVAGGRYPVWGPKGSDELSYVDGNGAMMAAAVTLSPSLRIGRVTKLFDWRKPPRGISGRPYDISPVDGRFLLVNPGKRDPHDVIDISVVLNWFEELRERRRPN